MELHQKLIDYVESQLPALHCPILAIPMAEGDEGVSITIGPSSPERRYFDGAVYDTMLLYLSAKDKDSIRALKTVTDIAYTLEKAHKNAVVGEGFCFSGCQIYTNPNFAYMDKRQIYVYVSLIKAFFTRR